MIMVVERHKNVERTGQNRVLNNYGGNMSVAILYE